MNGSSRGTFHLSDSLFIQQPAKRENWQLRNSVIFISCKIAVIRDAEHPKVSRNFKVSGSHCVPEFEPPEISFMHKLAERVWLVSTSQLTTATQGTALHCFQFYAQRRLQKHSISFHMSGSPDASALRIANCRNFGDAGYKSVTM
jgi:hypothetical protein